MTGSNFRILSFDIERKCYEYVGIQDDEVADRTIVLSGEKLYLFYKPNIFQMSLQYEILDTKTTPMENLYFDQ